MVNIIMVSTFFIGGYVIGFIIGTVTGKTQGKREQSIDDMEYLRLKMIESEQDEARRE